MPFLLPQSSCLEFHSQVLHIDRQFGVSEQTAYNHCYYR